MSRIVYIRGGAIEVLARTRLIPQIMYFGIIMTYEILRRAYACKLCRASCCDIVLRYEKADKKGALIHRSYRAGFGRRLLGACARSAGMLFAGRNDRGDD